MKDHLRELVEERSPLGFDPRNVVREYLQARILGSLQSSGAMLSIAFQGGTALRFLYGLKMRGLLFELGVSPRADQVLRVKIEVDTNPPAGATVETTLVRRHLTLRLYHHDRASMLAGKLHAVLHRPWTKGRDLFDLLWYLSDREWPEPNLVLLNNALRQTGWTGDALEPESWRNSLRTRLQELDWDRAVSDVRPFLEPSANIELLTLEDLLTLL